MNSADRVGGWENHYLRMQRWACRSRKALNDLPQTDFHDALDTSLAYFVWCHSLRDWIIKDKAMKEDLVNAKLQNFFEWKIVRDLANRSKHLKLTQNPTDAEWLVSREYDPFAVVIEGRERHYMNLYFDGKKYRLAEIVKRSKDMWLQILTAENLI